MPRYLDLYRPRPDQYDYNYLNSNSHLFPMSWYFLITTTLLFALGTFLFHRWRFGNNARASCPHGAKVPGHRESAKDNKGVWPPPITSLPDITPETLKNYSPIPWRPYKPMDYRLTMGLSALDPNEWIQIDNGYPERISKRKELIEKYPSVVYGFNPEMVPAIEELYEYLLGYYLPRRYSGLFKIVIRKGLSTEEEPFLENLVTRDIYPIYPPSRAGMSEKLQWTKAVNYLLRAIGSNIEEDIFMLLPDNLLPHGTEEPEYKMRAFCTCFPSGFNAPGFIGKPLAFIHEPVPGYKEKLQMSMDRFFARIAVGKPWRRWNWTITIHDELCVPHGNETFEKKMPQPNSNEDPAKAKLRVEYQTLTRLPNSKALVFTVRTYLTSLDQIQNEPPPAHAGTEGRPEPGYGSPNGGGGPEDLASAIEGITGPMMIYKNFQKFNDKVVRYLRTGER